MLQTDSTDSGTEYSANSTSMKGDQANKRRPTSVDRLASIRGTVRGQLTVNLRCANAMKIFLARTASPGRIRSASFPVGWTMEFVKREIYSEIRTANYARFFRILLNLEATHPPLHVAQLSMLNIQPTTLQWTSAGFSLRGCHRCWHCLAQTHH